MPRREKLHHYVYKTVCNVTKKFYVGMHSTDDLGDGYIGSGKILLRSIKKYGRENHTKVILEILNSRATLRKQEQELVNSDLLADPLCMNLRLGGEGGSSGHSEETRKKIGMSRRGQVNNLWKEESRQKMSEYRTGKKHSDETKKKVSVANTGLKRSVEFRTKVSRALKKKANEIGERQRMAISGRHFYNDGTTVILVYDSDPRLSDPRWKKGKACQK